MNEFGSIVVISRGPIVPYGTTQLRCVQPMEYLKSKGFQVRSEDLHHFTPRPNEIILLHRTLGSKHVLNLVKYAQALGSLVVYDTDDLIFTQKGVQYLSKIGLKKYSKERLSIEKLIIECDAVSVSTSTIESASKALNSNTYLVKNALSYSFHEKAKHKALKSRLNDKVVIGYLSGSNTHNADFQVIEPALLKILEEFPDAVFLSVGPVSISEEFKKFSSRFQQKPFLPYDEFQDIFNLIDINLVPLEINEDFCQAKSELKFIEAGAYGVPSICSATVPHKEVITHGVNGYLVYDDSEWYEEISKLMDKNNRVSLGEQAKLTVLTHYSPKVRSNDWEELIKKISGGQRKNSFINTNLISLRFQFYKFFARAYIIVKSIERVIRNGIKGKKKL